MTQRTPGIPENSSVIIPRLVCRNPASAIDFYVDVFAAINLGASARLLVPAQNQFWGDRIAWIIDPAAHVWTIATRIEETTKDQRSDRWSQILDHGESVDEVTGGDKP